MTEPRRGLAAIVPAGGRARRFGSDKTLAAVGGTTLLERAVEACRASGAEPIVVVAPEAKAVAGTLTVFEDPPFGGPAAAIAAGLATIDLAAEAEVLAVAVVAADMPFADRALPALVDALAAHDDADGVWAVDAAGRHQPLLAVYRAQALRRGLRELGDPAGAPMRAVTRDLRLVEVAAGAAALDIDTPAALAQVGGEMP